MAWTEPRDWTTGELVTSTMLNEQIRDNLNAMFPIGTFLLRAANYTTVETAVEGRWLQCNGVNVSRATYAELFAYLNALTPALPFGSGDGSTTFTLPDARGRTLYAEGEHSQVDAMGDSEGSAIASRTPSHRHSYGFNLEGSGTNGAEPGRGNTLDSAAFSSFTSGESNLDMPSYLVAGSYFIKYTT